MKRTSLSRPSQSTNIEASCLRPWLLFGSCTTGIGRSNRASQELKDVFACIWLYVASTKLTEFDEESADDRTCKDQNGNTISLCCCIQVASSRVMNAIAQDGSAVEELLLLCPAKGLSWTQRPRLGQRGGGLAS